MNQSQLLRNKLKDQKIIRVMGAHDGLGAKLAEEAGFDAIWASGFEISASFAVPDANILTMTQYLERACEMVDVASIPVIADCDTGYGNSNNVIYMVKKYEAAGVAAVCIEDKQFPKINSYVAGRQDLAPIGEFVGKIMAAKNAQRSEDFIVIARVEALIAGQGMDEALKRAHAYIDAGADALLIHSKAKNADEIRTFCVEWNSKAPVVVVPTSYPMVPIDELAALGVRAVIYANQGLRASVQAMRETYQEILRTGHLLSVNEKITTMKDIFELQGMMQLKKAEQIYMRAGKDPVKVVIPAAGNPSYEPSMQHIVQDFPLAMLDINGKPLLKRNVETLYKLNITDISVVTGYNAEKFNVDGVHYIQNKNFQETTELDSIMMAAKDINGPALIAFSDVLFEKEVLERLIDSECDIALLIDPSMPKKESSIDYVVADHSPSQTARKLNVGKTKAKILRIGKNIDTAKAQYEFSGLSYFSAKGLQLLKDTHDQILKEKSEKPVSRHHFLNALQRIIDSGFSVMGIETISGWIEIRNFENYKAACSSYSS